MTEANSLDCSLCNASFSSKQQLAKHIHQHLFYRKYECASCTELFYTDEEREAHCKKKGHFHTFGMRVSSYCELYVNQFLKDIEHIATYGIDTVVMQRSKANLACDAAISKLPRKSSSAKRKQDSSSPSKRKASFSKSNDEDLSLMESNATHPNEAEEDLGEPSTSSARKAKESGRRIRMPTNDWMRIEVDNSTAVSPATQILSEALRTNAPEVRCQICKAMTSSDYVLRKHHVSSVHMPKDHTESDYVEILSALMQKAYPTMTYNDLQCQIGGCRKEYKCQSARRNHVLRIHFQNELSCPMKGCSFRSNDFPRINSHLKEDHGLTNGYLSIGSAAVRDQFNADRAKHNHRLTTLVQLAFPCHIPDISKSNPKITDVSSPGETVQSLITRIREKDRKFQTTPPNPLRLRSYSSSSDSDSSGTEKMHRPQQVATVVNKSKNKTSSKNGEADHPKSSTEDRTADSASRSSSSESDEEEGTARNSAFRHKHRCSPEKEQENGKKASTSSSSSSLESCDGSEKSEVDSHDKNSDTSKDVETLKETEEPGSDIDSMWNNASDKSAPASESGDDVQFVGCMPGPPVVNNAKEAHIDEVVLEDDEDEMAAPNASSEPITPITQPKRPQYRTLSISGVSVRADRENDSFFRPVSSPGVRTLPISGVCVRTDGTPLRTHTEMHRKSLPNGQHHTPQKHAAVRSFASEQQERRRELARRKFDLAEQRRASRKKNIHLSRNDNANLAKFGPPTSRKTKKGPKVHTPRSPFKRPASECSNYSKGPSYVVPKMKREASSHSDRFSRPRTTWQGKIKRFED